MRETMSQPIFMVCCIVQSETSVGISCCMFGKILHRWLRLLLSNTALTLSFHLTFQSLSKTQEKKVSVVMWHEVNAVLSRVLPSTGLSPPVSIVDYIYKKVADHQVSSLYKGTYTPIQSPFVISSVLRLHCTSTAFYFCCWLVIFPQSRGHQKVFLH